MDNQALTVIASHQSGAFSRPQALGAGATDAVLQRRVDVGVWQRVHPGVYAAFSGPLPPLTRMWAALLLCGHGQGAGPIALLSHGSAADRFGLRVRGVDAVHVTIAQSARVRPPAGIVVHRTRHLREVHSVRAGLPITRIEDTVVDLLAAANDVDSVVSLLSQACQSRLTTPARLSATLEQRTAVRHRRLARSVLVDVTTGAHSSLERRYLTDIERAHGLPRGERQVRHGAVCRDVVYRDYGTVAELDGRLDHSASRFRDLRRDNEAASTGLLTLRYGWADVAGRPCTVAAQVHTVLSTRGHPPQLRRCGRSCSARAAASSPTRAIGR